LELQLPKDRLHARAELKSSCPVRIAGDSRFAGIIFVELVLALRLLFRELLFASSAAIL
jgi:hypothetical protein